MPSQQDIERMAYELWEREGRPHGMDHHYYYEAERALNGDGAKPKKTSTRKPAAAKSTTKATPSKSRSTKKAA
jgi:hypothetical protein